MRRLLVLTMTTGLAIGGAAFAGDPAMKGGSPQLPTFSEIDANQNGLISADEAERSQVVKEVFTRADTDKDGSLSASEYVKAGSKKPTP